MSQRQKRRICYYITFRKKIIIHVTNNCCEFQLIQSFPLSFSPLTILVLFLFRWIIFISHQFCLHYYYLLYNDKHFSLLNFCTIDSDTTSINSKSFSWSENKLLVEYTQLFFSRCHFRAFSTFCSFGFEGEGCKLQMSFYFLRVWSLKSIHFV